MDDDEANEIAGEPIAEENAGGAAGGPILDAAGQPILDEEAEEITGVPLIDKNAGVSPLNMQECPPLMKPKKLQECPTLKPTIQLIAASLASRVCT